MLIDNFLLLRVNVGRKFGDLLPLIVDVWECVDRCIRKIGALKESLRTASPFYSKRTEVASSYILLNSFRRVGINEYLSFLSDRAHNFMTVAWTTSRFRQ